MTCLAFVARSLGRVSAMQINIPSAVTSPSGARESQGVGIRSAPIFFEFNREILRFVQPPAVTVYVIARTEYLAIAGSAEKPIEAVAAGLDSMKSAL
jgi:hypothetical protein